jgi:RNA polymerase sigma factor (sigma-70 family)
MTARLLPFRSGEPRRPARAGRLPSSDLRPVGAGPGGAAAPVHPSQQAPRFRELVLPHLDAAYSFARYLARDPALAEDIAQEALLKALRTLDSLRGEVKPWLLTIVRNAYFDWRRRGDERAVGGPAAEVALARTPDDSQESAETALIRQGDLAALRTAIEAIPEPFREALVLRDLEELSYREIAAVTGAPMGTVMSRLARARRMLAERMGVLEPAR